MALKSSSFVFLFLFLVCVFVDFTSALGKHGLFCNMCNSMKDDQTTACRELETYTSVNCTSLIPSAKYCVILNGNLTIVESSGLINQALGPRRTCLIDLDRYEVDEKNIKPGCFPAYVDKANYLAHKHFHFDGEICLCNDEDNCNSGETWVPKKQKSGETWIPKNSGNSFSPLIALGVFLTASLISYFP